MHPTTDSVLREALRGPPPRPPEASLVTETVRLVQDYQRLHERQRRARSNRWLQAYGAASALACIWIIWSGPHLTWTPHGLSAVAEWLVPIGCAALPWLARNIEAWMMGCVRLLQSAPHSDRCATGKEADP